MRRLTAAVGIALVVVLAGTLRAGEAASQVKVKPGHPKVMLTKADIERVARNIKANGPGWQALRKQVDAGTASVAVYGLIYQATRDDSVGRKGVEILMSDKTAKGMAAGNYEDACLGYDWLYPLLSDDQKKTLFDRVKAGVAREDLTTKMSAPWTNFVQRASMRIAVAGCAFTSEFPEAQSWADLAYKQWTDFHLPAIKIVEQGGGWPEGALYSYIVYSSLTRLADTYWTATDKNPYADTQWFADRLVWWRFHTWPLPKDFHGRAFYMYDPYGDSEKWRAPMENQEIGAELLVMRYIGEHMDELPNPNKTPGNYLKNVPPSELFGDTGVLSWRWYMRQLHAPITSLSEWATFAYYEDSSPDMDLTKAVMPNTPPADLSWYAKGTGQIFIRSSWLPDATWISYQCGPRFTYHQHVDQGAFNIFKMGDLTGESGVYEPSGPSDQEGHLQGYASRAIAHNTINIYDPKEVFSGYRSGNSPRDDGGERTWRPFSNTAGSAADWKGGFDKGAYDTGRVTEFKDYGNAVYIASDLTGAYNSDKYVSEPNKTKVHEVTRQLVYFRPQKPGDLDCLVVFDRVRATDPSFEKRVLVHFPNDVRVIGNEKKTAEGEFSYAGDLAQADTGGGRLFIRSVYPKAVKINKVGGPGKEYWVFGKNFPVPNTPWERGYGQWRLEIMPAKQQADDCFLTVYFPSDKSATAAPAVTRLAGRQTLGAQVMQGKKVLGIALFASEGEMGASVLLGTDAYIGRQFKEKAFSSGAKVDTNSKPDGDLAETLPCPAITDVKVSDVTTMATVTWKTAKATVGYVEFGDTPEMKYLIQPSEKPGTEHRAVLRGLEPKSEFYVRAAARDNAGNVGFSAMYALQTPEDKTAPQLLDLKAEAVNPTDAILSWSTDDKATGTITAVDPRGNKVTSEAPVAAAEERVTLDGLKADTEYDVTVTTANAKGLESSSKPLKIKTPKMMDGYFETAFEDGKLDAWQVIEPGKADIEKDAVTKANSLVFNNSGAKTPAMIVYKGHGYGDFTLRVKARTLEGDGNEYRDYCVVFGYQDPQNYYAAWMCGAVDDSIPGIVRVKDGKWTLIGSRPNLITLADREWHGIEVVRKGTHMQAFFDGVMTFEADDSSFGPGKIGFGSNNDSAAFADLKVLPSAAIAPAPPTVRTKKLTIEGLVME